MLERSFTVLKAAMQELDTLRTKNEELEQVVEKYSQGQGRLAAIEREHSSTINLLELAYHALGQRLKATTTLDATTLASPNFVALQAGRADKDTSPEPIPETSKDTDLLRAPPKGTVPIAKGLPAGPTGTPAGVLACANGPRPSSAPPKASLTFTPPRGTVISARCSPGDAANPWSPSASGSTCLPSPLRSRNSETDTFSECGRHHPQRAAGASPGVCIANGKRDRFDRYPAQPLAPPRSQPRVYVTAASNNGERRSPARSACTPPREHITTGRNASAPPRSHISGLFPSRRRVSFELPNEREAALNGMAARQRTSSDSALVTKNDTTDKPTALFSSFVGSSVRTASVAEKGRSTLLLPSNGMRVP